MSSPLLRLSALLLLANVAHAGAPTPSSVATPTPHASPTQRGPSPEVRDSLAKLREELSRTYEELATWCHDAKLYGQRDLMYEGLIGLEPDHAQARKTLDYRWDRKQSTWRQGRYRRPKDRGKPGALEEFEAKRGELAESLRERVLLLVSKPGVDRDMREDEVRLYLPLAPEDAFLRRAVGQVTGGEEGVWLSADAVATTKRRAQLEQLLADTRAAVPELRPWDVGPPTADLPLRWTESWMTTRARVTGTVTPEEIKQCAEVIHMITELMPVLLPTNDGGSLRRGFRDSVLEEDLSVLGRYSAYLLQGPAETRVLLDAFPDLTPEERELFPLLSTGWLDGSHSIGVWERARPKRLDGLARQVIGMHLTDHFSITTRNGWVWEGLGLYLTNLTVGTRLTYFVATSSYVDNKEAPKLGARLMSPKADWLAILVEEMQKPRPPRLVYVVGRDVNSMSIRELLLSYGLAAYMIEMHPELLPRVLTRLGRAGNPVEVLESEFGRRLPDLEKDLLEWAHMAIRL